MSWADKFKPTHESDIQISKTAYNEIKSFFENIFPNHELSSSTISPFFHVLIIFGPSGCGKHSTLNYICDTMKITIKKATSINYKDISCIKEANSSQILISGIKNAISAAKCRRIVLIDDIPVDRSMVSSYKTQLDYVIKKYMEAKNDKCPIIFCLNSSLFNEQNLKKLLSDEFILKECKIIFLKEYTDAAMKKMLKRIYDLEPKLNKSNMNLQIDSLVANCRGDIKLACNQLYFQCLPREKIEDINDNENYRANKKINKVDLKKTKKIENGYESQNKYHQKGSKQLLPLIFNSLLKDRQFSLFHTIGKILYNKRYDPDMGKSRVMKPEEYQCDKYTFYFNPLDLIYQLPCEMNIFRDFLFENSIDFFGDIEDVVQVLDAYDLSDLLETYNRKLERVIEPFCFVFYGSYLKILIKCWPKGNDQSNQLNEELNTLMVCLGIMIKNIHVSTENTNQALKPIIKPKTWNVSRNIKARKIELKEKYPGLPLVLAIEYEELIKNRKITHKTSGSNSWSGTQHFRENFRFVNQSNLRDNEMKINKNYEDDEEEPSLDQLQMNQINFEKKSSFDHRIDYLNSNDNSMNFMLDSKPETQYQRLLYMSSTEEFSNGEEYENELNPDEDSIEEIENI